MPEKVYRIMMDKFKLGRFEDDEYSKFFEKYKERDLSTGKYFANPPSCC
jgi:collagenase-like PrtC family protease